MGNSAQNLWYLVAAYAVIWLAVLGYVYALARRQAGVNEGLTALRSEIARLLGEESAKAAADQ
jgi:CcmD family protein